MNREKSRTDVIRMLSSGSARSPYDTTSTTRVTSQSLPHRYNLSLSAYHFPPLGTRFWKATHSRLELPRGPLQRRQNRLLPPLLILGPGTPRIFTYAMTHPVRLGKRRFHAVRFELFHDRVGFGGWDQPVGCGDDDECRWVGCVEQVDWTVFGWVRRVMVHPC